MDTSSDDGEGDGPVNGNGGIPAGFLWPYRAWEEVVLKPTPPIEGCDPPGNRGSSWALMLAPLESQVET